MDEEFLKTIRTLEISCYFDMCKSSIICNLIAVYEQTNAIALQYVAAMRFVCHRTCE